MVGSGVNTPKWPENSPEEQAHAALDELLRRALLQRTTGHAYLRVELNQGLPRVIRISTEEIFTRNT